MKEPLWLDRPTIDAIHSELLVLFGGSAGLREENLLESALHRPLHLFAYGESTSLYQLAASYAAGIVKNHPFIDGNKRTGFMAAYTFLGQNGLRFNAPEAEVVLQTLALAAGDLDEAAYADWLAGSCT